MSLYPADLARIHDEGFGDFARAAACELLTRLPRRGLVVELGCGTGISSQILIGAGYEVLGIDVSSDMLALARRRARQGRFREGSIWDAELPPCTAVTAIGEVINYEGVEARLPELFGRIFDSLEPGGLFLFDFATPGRGGQGPQVREGDGWWIESATVEDEASKALERRMTLVVDGERREQVHRLQLYDREWVQTCLEGPGFSPEALDRYCEFGFWPGYAAFAAVRP